MKEGIRLAIGIVHTGFVKTDTVLSLILALSKLPEVDLYFAFIGGCYVHQNRELVVEHAKKWGATHLMFIDTDVVFPDDGIRKLLELDKDIVGANYHKRRFPLEGNIKIAGKDGKFIEVKAEDIPKEPFECAALPTGFMLINMRVFDKIKKPYFFFDERSNSEDIYFCLKARDAGIEVWCDPTIKVGHIGDFTY